MLRFRARFQTTVAIALGTIAVARIHADDTPPKAAAIRAAEELADVFFARKFENAVDKFDATMTSALPADKLRDVFAELTKQVGPFERRGAPRSERVQQYEVVFIPCQFKNGSLEMKVVLDQKLKVAGLFFVPPQAVSVWKPPAYADVESFDERPFDVVTVSPAADGAPAREWRLPGQLTVPKGKGPFPAVVLVHGSGPNDADETIGANKPFKDLAWGLASRRIVVLRYTKRTRQYGKESLEGFPEFTVREETEDDAQSAVRLLQRIEGVDPAGVFLLGHSLGGQLAPRIAERTPELAGIIIFAGNTRSLARMVVDQIRYIAELDGQVTVEEQAQLDAVTREAADAESSDLKRRDLVSVLGSKVPGSYFLDLRSYDAAKTAAQLKCPILVLQGESDYQVTMEDFAGWQKELGDQPRAQLRSFPKLNHLFMPVAGKSTPENTLAAGHVDEQAIDEIAGWIKISGAGR